MLMGKWKLKELHLRRKINLGRCGLAEEEAGSLLDFCEKNGQEKKQLKKRRRVCGEREGVPQVFGKKIRKEIGDKQKKGGIT